MEIERRPHPDQLLPDDARRFAADRARNAPAHIGAFVLETRVANDRHDWTVVVSDGQRWAIVHAYGTGISPWVRVHPTLVARAVEDAVPRDLPECYRVDVFGRRGPVHIASSVLAGAG